VCDVLHVTCVEMLGQQVVDDRASTMYTIQDSMVQHAWRKRRGMM